MSVAHTRLDRYKLPRPHGQALAPAKRLVSLEVVRGRVSQPLRTVAEAVFLIGSGTDCDLVLGDDSFPESYAAITTTSGGVNLRHLGGGPAILVRGSAVSQFGGASIVSGDLVEMGSLAFRVRIVPAVAETVALRVYAGPAAA